jgi:hypothetical protein
VTGTWSREELQRAHDRYVAVAQEAGRTGNWRPWAEMFTPDATYVEHHYGRVQPRQLRARREGVDRGEAPNRRGPEVRAVNTGW